MNIATDQHRGLATKFTLEGSLDSDTAAELERQLGDVISAPTNTLVFDLAELRFISSAGLRVIFKAQKSMEKKGGEVAMINLQPQVEKVFDIVKALPSLSIFQSEAEMDDYLQRIQSREADKHQS